MGIEFHFHLSYSRLALAPLLPSQRLRGFCRVQGHRLLISKRYCGETSCRAVRGGWHDAAIEPSFGVYWKPSRCSGILYRIIACLAAEHSFGVVTLLRLSVSQRRLRLSKFSHSFQQAHRHAGTCFWASSGSWVRANAPILCCLRQYHRRVAEIGCSEPIFHRMASASRKGRLDRSGEPLASPG